MSKSNKALALNHDINNQLGTVMGNLELLLLKNPELKENLYIERATHGLYRARDLSHELAQNLQDSNNEESDKKDFILISIQEHFLNNSKPAYDKLMEVYNIDIELKVTTIDAPKYAYLNPTELVRLRENIISNAVAAGATKLKVVLEMKETYVVATFSDNGKGMSQDELDKTILFQHGDGKVHGIGTRSIVEGANKYGYSIRYSSKEGEGTTIRTLVPYHEE